MAYRLILGREPESEAVIKSHCLSHQDIGALRTTFLNSPEFRGDLARQQSIDIDIDPLTLDQMFIRVEQCWRSLGETEPYWSVLSNEQYRSAAFVKNADNFYNFANNDADRLSAWLLRDGVNPASIHPCCEYGCGVGRVTGRLAAQFPSVIAYDISESHLRVAKQHLSDLGRSNVTFRRVDKIASLYELEPVDLVMSIIVLQHNPPPVVAQILRMLLTSLNPRGVAYFQVPTYGAGYCFDAGRYLQTKAEPGAFEMHVVPQSAVFRIIRDAGCAILEVRRDFSVGEPGWISNTFLAQRS